MAEQYAIVVENLWKSYGKNTVLKGINLRVKRGTMLALLGPNGAGKTTTVRIMSTLLGLDDGTVMVQGHDVARHPDRVRREIGLTGQSAAVDEILTGRENLIMMGQLYRLTKRSATLRADELLSEFDLLEAGNRSVKTYSGGMRRRLDLAVSLIATPPIIFLDEPTTGLDPRSRIAMWDSINRLKADGKTILLTTQYLEEADQLADSIVVIDGGKVIAQGTAKQLKAKVGKDRLELTFKTHADLVTAKEKLGATVVESNDTERTLTVMINDTSMDVTRALQQLAKTSVVIESMAIHKPTLDDVFLSLTGKTKRSQSNGDIL
jgi:ABC-2 type transport system ATP-binding protein